MRIHHLVLLLLLPLCALPLSAQPSSEDLYFPPEISVGVTQEFEVEMRLTYQAHQEKVRERLKFRDYLVGNERYITRTEPLLPIIYFDPASWVIPGRYRQLSGRGEADEYRDEEAIVKTTRIVQYEGKYDDLLNILGYRMRHNPEARIDLQGTWSTEPGEDDGVAQERAEVVREYLTTIWGIAPERIHIREPRCVADSSDHVMRQQEARSVRIIPDRRNLVAPVTWQSVSHVSETFSMRVRLIPRIPIEEIRSVRLRFIIEDEIVSDLELPAAEIFDESSATWYVGWALPTRVTSSVRRLYVQVVVEDVGGRRRTSGAQAIPIRWREDRRDMARDTDTALQFEYLAWPFRGGDTTLPIDEERKLAEWLHAIAPELEKVRDRIARIELMGSGDLSEAEGIDPVHLATAVALKAAQSPAWDAFFNGADDLPVVYTHHIPTRANGFPDYDAVDSRIYRARYGEDRYRAMVGSNAFGEQIRSLVDRYDRDPEIINSLAALSLARARSLCDYLCIALDTTGIPVRCVEDVTSRRYSSGGNSLLWDPVARTSRRSVRIRIYLNDEVVSEGRRQAD